MSNLQGINELLGETGSGLLNSALIRDPEMFKRFLESLAPDQMTMLILSGALDVLFLGEEETQQLEKSFPLATERQGFDFEEWKNRPDPKIR